MIECVFPISLFVIPIILYIWFWYQFNSFRKDEENIKCFRKLREIDCGKNIPRKKPETIKAIISQNRRKGNRENAIYSGDRDKFTKKYKRIYWWTKIYIVLTWIMLCVWLGMVIFRTIKSQWDFFDTSFLLYLADGICLVGLGLPPILKSSKSKGIQYLGEKVDTYIESCLNEDGVVGKYVLHIAITTIVLEVIAVIFYYYFIHGLRYLSSASDMSHLTCLIILLGIFRYLGLWLLSKILRPICSGALNLMVHGRWRKEKIRKEYIEDVIKNNMYLIFMLFHIMGTELIIDGSWTEVQVTIEAIGIIYLVDTYIENMKKMIEKEPMFEDPVKEQLPSK